MFQKVDPKKPLSDMEHEILAYWKEKDIFRKSLSKNAKKKKFVFFDGPPFANGLPHYGHILANALKDAVTRYYSMKGYYVPRTNGWDCHGLPVEYEIEKELEISGKKGIEELGIGIFNNKCRESVFRYTEEWQKMFERVGRWLDFDQTYATLDNSYMESIWWVFRQIWDKKLVYQGHKSMHICPRCSTPLSNFEVSLGYKEVTDTAVTVKFELKDQPRTYFLAWTTTPWSLLSVMGLAVSKEITYVKVKVGDDYYILAKKRLEAVFEGLNYEIVAEFSGDQIAGKAYKHIFDFYNNHEEVKKSKNVFHTVLTDYVSDEDGTGIVTINGAFGDIDMEAARHYKIPMIVNVSMDGTFTAETGRYSGKFVKGQDQNIAADLEERGLLFRKENYRHSYPHCWRCDTPLLNYATRSWFIEVKKIKNKLLKNNQKINWQPAHIKDGRFGKWLENVRDWSISRNRYWGAAIPVWQCENCGSQECIAAIDDLSRYKNFGIQIVVARHAEYEGNLTHTLHSDIADSYGLTASGKEQANLLADKLQDQKFDMILTSQLTRAKETAAILAAVLKVSVQEEAGLNEFQFGDFDKKGLKEYQKCFNSVGEYMENRVSPNTETFLELSERMRKFLDYVRLEFAGKRLLLITHGSPIIAIKAALGRISTRHAAYLSFHDKLLKNCEFEEFWTGNEARNEQGIVDLHKPYIDEVTLDCPKCKSQMRRIPEVFDCWFESGAMPYAQLHYPYEEKIEFDDNFPAHFIGEGLDQTRGWFYTLHVLATILFNKPAFRNVIVNGILLAADGEKLSKRKKNYPDPYLLFESQGVDSLRYFLYSSTAPLAEDVRFSEKHVDEVVKKLTLTLWHTYIFLVTYAAIDKWRPTKLKFKPRHKLDRWILSELQILIDEVTGAMDEYNLTAATRPFLNFVDNLSNWYVRRSRRRFWKSENDQDKNEAYAVLHHVITVTAKLLAPFMPFIAEAMYLNLNEDQESVHLCTWPKVDRSLIDEALNKEIYVARQIVELGHSIRASHKIKVRQPLGRLIVVLPKELPRPSDIEVILEELNVKELDFVDDASNIAIQKVELNFRLVGSRFGKETPMIAKLVQEGKYEINNEGFVKVADYLLDPAKNEVSIGYQAKTQMADYGVTSDSGIVVALDIRISEDLKKEGIARDLVRLTQELRKKAEYNVSDRIYLLISSSKFQDVVTEYADFIRKETLAIEIQQKDDFEGDIGEEYEIEGERVKIAVKRQ